MPSPPSRSRSSRSSPSMPRRSRPEHWRRARMPRSSSSPCRPAPGSIGGGADRCSSGATSGAWCVLGSIPVADAFDVLALPQLYVVALRRRCAHGLLRRRLPELHACARRARSARGRERQDRCEPVVRTGRRAELRRRTRRHDRRGGRGRGRRPELPAVGDPHDRDPSARARATTSIGGRSFEGGDTRGARVRLRTSDPAQGRRVHGQRQLLQRGAGRGRDRVPGADARRAVVGSSASSSASGASVGSSVDCWPAASARRSAPLASSG